MKLRATYATKVFITTRRLVCIKQDQLLDHEQIATVLLTREQARLVAAEIARLVADDTSWVAKD